jgi:hypothetical protein
LHPIPLCILRFSSFFLNRLVFLCVNLLKVTLFDFLLVFFLDMCVCFDLCQCPSHCQTLPAKPVNEVVVRLQCRVLCEVLFGNGRDITFPSLKTQKHNPYTQNPQTKSLSVHSIVFFVMHEK